MTSLARSWVLAGQAKPDAAAPARPARVEDATRQFADSVARPVDAVRPCRFSATDRQSRPLGPIFDRAVTAGGRQVAAAWLVCTVIGALALWPASGPHDRAVPVAAFAYQSTIAKPDTGCPPAPLPCARYIKAGPEPW
jgi:hypothetical protein